MNEPEQQILKISQLIQHRDQCWTSYQQNPDLADAWKEINAEITKLIHKNIAELFKNSAATTISDLLTLVGRLYDEDESTFAPETIEVMRRWKPVFAAKYLKG
jgi:cytochrome P450